MPWKTSNPLNGVTTYDLILIAKHILGLQQIQSPYKMIAADANNSNSITSFDLVELRKLILGIYTELPNNDSWRFVDKSYVFPDSLNPFSTAFPETTSYVVNVSSFSVEFVGIKIGDLNGSALAHSFTGTEGEDRAAAYLQVPERYLQAGETIELPLYAAEAADWEGFQFSMRYDSELLELESVEPGVLPDMDADNFNAAVPGVLNASWFSLAAQPVGPQAALCTLRLRARAPLRTQDALWLDESGSLRAEAYDAGGPRRLGLLYKNERGVSASARPNPTTAGFEITLDMPAAGALELVLSDALGRVRYRAEYAPGAGVQTLQAPAEAMPEAGLYFWSVQCGGAQWQGRVVKE